MKSNKLFYTLVRLSLGAALLLSLTYGGAGPGLVGFGFPWRERRIEAPALRVSLVPADRQAAEAAGTAAAERMPSGPSRPPMAVRPAPAPAPTGTAARSRRR